MRKACLILGLVLLPVLFLSAAPSALAAHPTVQVIVSQGSNLDIQSCGTFDVLLTFRHKETITTFYDTEGVPTRLTIRFNFTATLTNSVTGKAAYETGDWSLFADPSGDAHPEGLALMIRVPGSGVVLIELASVHIDSNGQASVTGTPTILQGQDLICSILS